MKRRSRFLAIGMVAVLAMPVAAQAKAGDFLVSRKFHGAVALGVSLWSFRAAYDARQDANDYYDQYKAAGTAQTASEIYDESRREDTKAALLLGVGIGALAYSIHAFLAEDDDLPKPSMQEGLVTVKGVAMDVTSDPYRGGIRVGLRKGF